MPLNKYQKCIINKSIDLETLSEPSAYLEKKRLETVKCLISSYLDCQALFIPFNLNELNDIVCTDNDEPVFPDMFILEEVREAIHELPENMVSTVYDYDKADEDIWNQYILAIMKEHNSSEILLGVYDDIIYTIYQTKETNYYKHLKLGIYDYQGKTDICTILADRVGFNTDMEARLMGFLEEKFKEEA